MMKKNGFTLVELLLCIGIIGVVTAMGMLITKRSADSAYNLYYYTGYINLYNAIADARTMGLTSNSDIIKHAKDILSSKVQTKVTTTTISTSNGITYTCSSNDNNNYFEIIMTIPQRKTRQNNGTASTRFIYYNENGGLLIPVASADENNINLQERNDLLPTYIDNGIVGRAVKTSSSYKYDRPAYYSYREAYCRLNNNASLTINGETVISCAGLQAPTASEVNSGFLKVANPRKVR